MTDRHLHWPSCGNVRDLGGLRTADGGRIRPGALVRADDLERLTTDGWAALEDHGVRTVIDLRNPDEVRGDGAPRPDSLTTLRMPLDGQEVTEFWSRWTDRPEFGTPHYYGPWLERFPERAARVIAAIAHAEPGGVAYHCGVGRDRTGLITMLLLAVAGVPAEEIAGDYALSPVVEDYWETHPATPAEVLAGVLADLDAEAYLRSAGLGVGDLAALRHRMVESAGAPG